MKKFAVWVIVLCLAGPAIAQEKSEKEAPGNVARIAWFQAMPGMQKQMEEGIALHMQWHRKVNDPRAWQLWQVVAGEKTGWLVGGVFGHHWSDFDNPPVSGEEDSADADTNTRPYIGPVVTEFLELLPALSRPPATDEPGRLLALNVVRVKMGRVPEYLEAVKKTKDALEKTNHPLRYTAERVAYGAQFATFYFVHPVENWAGLGPMEPSFGAALTEVYGNEEAGRIMQAISETVGEESNMILAYRPDLSYTPADQ